MQHAAALEKTLAAKEERRKEITIHFAANKKEKEIKKNVNVH